MAIARSGVGQGLQNRPLHHGQPQGSSGCSRAMRSLLPEDGFLSRSPVRSARKGGGVAQERNVWLATVAWGFRDMSRSRRRSQRAVGTNRHDRSFRTHQGALIRRAPTNDRIRACQCQTVEEQECARPPGGYSAHAARDQIAAPQARAGHPGPGQSGPLCFPRNSRGTASSPRARSMSGRRLLESPKASSARQRVARHDRDAATSGIRPLRSSRVEASGQRTRVKGPSADAYRPRAGLERAGRGKTSRPKQDMAGREEQGITRAYGRRTKCDLAQSRIS